MANYEDIEKGLKNSFVNIKKDIDVLKNQLNNNQNHIKELLEENKELKETMIMLIKRMNQKDDTKIKTEMFRSIKRNKKDIIKNKIIQQIKEKQYTPAELKEIIVDDNNYCSKATFYRYLSEIDQISEITINNKKTLILNQENKN